MGSLPTLEYVPRLGGTRRARGTTPYEATPHWLALRLQIMGSNGRPTTRRRRHTLARQLMHVKLLSSMEMMPNCRFIGRARVAHFALADAVPLQERGGRSCPPTKLAHHTTGALTCPCSSGTGIDQSVQHGSSHRMYSKLFV